MATTVYFAKWILNPDNSIRTNGAIAVCNDSISSIGSRGSIHRSSKDRIVNLGNVLLLPGFINSHIHLEHLINRSELKQDPDSFTSWSLKKESRLMQASEHELRTRIKLGIRECLANGITSIIDTCKRDISWYCIQEAPIRSWIMYEILQQKHHLSDDDFIHQLQSRLSQIPNQQKGVCAQTMYSLSSRLLKTLNTYTKSHHLLWSCHLSESAEELQACSEKKGDLYFHIHRTCGWPFETPVRSALYYALTNNLLQNNPIIYHGNYISPEELSLLAAKNASVVLCCQYSQLMGHKQFPLESALNRNVNICLGTELPFSSNTINLFDELYCLKQLYPYIPATTMINWVTQNPAKALHASHYLGTLEVGKKADIIGISLVETPRTDILEEMLLSQPKVEFVLVNGEEVII